MDIFFRIFAGSDSGTFGFHHPFKGDEAIKKGIGRLPSRTLQGDDCQSMGVVRGCFAGDLLHHAAGIPSAPSRQPGDSDDRFWLCLDGIDGQNLFERTCFLSPMDRNPADYFRGCFCFQKLGRYPWSFSFSRHSFSGGTFFSFFFWVSGSFSDRSENRVPVFASFFPSSPAIYVNGAPLCHRAGSLLATIPICRQPEAKRYGLAIFH